MTQMIFLDESNVSRRIVYLWSVLSNGTTPAANEAGGQPTMSVAGLAQWNSAGTLLAISAASGLYAVRLGTSDVSVLGPGILRYSSASALEVSANLMIVGFTPYGSLSTFDPSTTSVGLKAQTHSGATVGSYASLVPGTYSNVTIGGVTRVNSSVTIADANYSAVTVRVGGIAPGTYSGVTVGINNITPGTYSGVTVGTAGGTFSLAPGEYSDVTVRTSVLSGHTPQTGDNFARLGAPAGASVSADIAAVKVDTAAILVDTGTTLDAAIAAVKSDTAAILVDTGTTLDAAIAAVKSDTAAILVDTGTTLDTAVAAIKVKTDQMVYTVANRLDATINSAVTLAAGTYSDVTIGGVTRVNSNVTIADADYSGVTVRASNITIATGGIVAASFGAGAIDAVALATDAGQEFADRVLLRNVASGSDGGRSVAEALYALRNRVAMDGSIGTVYQVNDTSSAWTFSVQTVSTNSGLVNQIDPG